MGKIFYDMGLLASAAVEECSATDLVGQYVGQTGPKTQKLLEKALGKVLFIDEAYRLADGHFAKEAMDELVDCLTKPKFAQKLIVILAGYDEDINRLMSTNPGLTSRFPETISFKHLSPEHCFELFQKSLPKRDNLSSTAVQHPSATFKAALLELFENLAQLPAWGNARDVKTLAKSVTQKVLSTETGDASFSITEEIVLSAIHQMVTERKFRKESKSASRHPMFPKHQQLALKSGPLPPALTTLTHAASTKAHSTPPPPPPPPPALGAQQSTSRDRGVSDDIWAQLQSDKHDATEREQQHQKLLITEKQAQDELKKQALAEQEARRKIEEESNAEARRLLELERLKAELEWRKQMEITKKIEEERKAKEQERKREQAVQAKLRELGICPMGFRWIKQASGYRCAGGSHFVSNLELGL